MTMRWAWWLFCGITLLAGGCGGQSTIVVNVGAHGSFFEPSTISAQVGDVVSFVFQQAAHSVIQTTFEEPCFPMKGGFSSGVVTRPSDSAAAPIWNLTITNSSQPIWFYCGMTVPTSHCASGMVGGINIPTIEAFNAFQNYAKSASNPPTSIPVVLAGQGASATSAPQPPLPSLPSQATSLTSSTTSSSLSTTPSMDPTPTSAASSSTPAPVHKKNTAAIIGGAVGGGVGGLLILLIVFLLLRRWKRDQRRGSKDFFRYNAPSPDLSKLNPAFVSTTATGGAGKGASPGPGYGLQNEKERYLEKEKYSAPPSSASHTANSTAHSSPDPLIPKNQLQGDNQLGNARRTPIASGGRNGAAVDNVTRGGSTGGNGSNSRPRRPQAATKTSSEQLSDQPTKPASTFQFHNPAYHLPSYARPEQSQPQTQTQIATQPQRRPEQPTTRTRAPRPQPNPPAATSSSSQNQHVKGSSSRIPAPAITIPTASAAPPPAPLQEQDAGAISNMDALARQVAAVLMERPTTLRPQPLGPRLPGDSSRSSMAGAEVPAPPKYGAGAT